MRVLGISAFYHDSAAALIEDGRIVAAENCLLYKDHQDQAKKLDYKDDFGLD